MITLLALAVSATVTPGQWSLYRSTSIVSRHASEAACVDAAKALGVARSYTCRTSTGVVVSVTVDPPPPPPVDTDGDGFADSVDLCPTVPGVAPDGCPVAPPPPPPPPVPPPPVPAGAAYAAPLGSGSSCTDTAPCSIDTALASGSPVVLKDGAYPGIGWNGSAEPRRILSGVTVQAQNPGGAVINGLWIGRSTRKDSNITVRDVRVEGGVNLYNTQRVTIKNVGVHGPLDVGTNDHTQGNTDNLIEDVWVWASGQRIIAINYRADRNVWRRVIVRGDGCGTAACSGSGNPNVGVTIYDSSDVSFQNVVVLDRVLASGDSPYADFACAQHTAGAYLWGRNEWLGIVSLNAPDQALYCEPDQVIAGAISATIKDALLWNGYGLNLARSGKFVVDGAIITNKGGGDGVRVAPELAGSGSSVSRVTIGGSGRYAVNSAVAPSQCNVSGTWQSAYNQTACSGAGSGAAVWALPPRYGVDGSRYGDAGVNAVQGSSLLPWPNDARIRAEMCVNTTRGLCSAPSVTSYLQAR